MRETTQLRACIQRTQAIMDADIQRTQAILDADDELPILFDEVVVKSEPGEMHYITLD